MCRTVIVLPNFLGETPDDSPLLQKLDTLRTMAELGELKRLRPLPNAETPEAMWLGMAPSEGQMRQGPLTVSAFGYDPPERSTHFHVSLLGLVDNITVAPPPIVPQEELNQILEQAKKLNTRSLTFLSGENTDHALVWEGLGDMQTQRADQIIGQPIKHNLPEGDSEKALRRFIDDSVNMLSDLELNERRLDEGLPPLNLLWPWGQGIRRTVPNLILKRGEKARVESASLRLAGLTRLTGYQHGDRQAFGKGTNTRLERSVEIALKEDLTIMVIQAPEEMRQAGLQEELHWFVHEMDNRLLKPLFDNVVRNPARVAILAPGSREGLALLYETRIDKANAYPFDERSLEERSLPRADAWELIEQALTPLPGRTMPSNA